MNRRHVAVRGQGQVQQHVRGCQHEQDERWDGRSVEALPYGHPSHGSGRKIRCRENGALASLAA